jgi:hypothetical protein
MDPSSVGVDFGSGVNGSARPQFPWGMQYTFPCEFDGAVRIREANISLLSCSLLTISPLCLGGGMPLSTNRTNWPVGGGAISIAPGLAPGFKNSFIYINIAKTEANALAPGNFSRLAMPPLAITGRDDLNPWPGQFCLPQVPMPAGVQFNVGDLATIQVVQVAANGQAVYNVSVTPESRLIYQLWLLQSVRQSHQH